MSENSSAQPGGIIWQACEITNYKSSEKIDVRFVVEEMEIVEDMSQTFMSGHLVLRENLSLLTRLPIVGGEKLNISFVTPTPPDQTTPNKPFTHEFVVTAVKHLESQTLRDETFILEFESPQVVPNSASKVARAFTSMPISEMIKRICVDYLKIDEKKLKISDSRVQRDFVVPNIPPSEAITILASEAATIAFAPSDYVFFEDRDNFNFITVDELRSGYRNLFDMIQGDKPSTAFYDQVIDEEYFFTDQNLDNPEPQNSGTTTPTTSTTTGTNSNGSPTSPASDEEQQTILLGGSKPPAYRRIIGYSIPTVFDLKKAIVMGLFDNSIFEIDIWAKTFKTHQFNYYKQWNEIQMIYERGKHRIIPENSNFKNANGESHQRIVLTNKYFAESYDKELKPRERSDVIMHRVSAIAQMEQLGMNLVVPGDSDRKVGHSIRVRVPEFGATDDILKSRHKYLSGKWLVMSLKHRFNKSAGYYTHVFLAKNCYEEEISDTPGKVGDTPGSNSGTQSEGTAPQTTPTLPNNNGGNLQV